MELAKELPPPGQITSRSELIELGATELVLSNGMRVYSLDSNLSVHAKANIASHSQQISLSPAMHMCWA